MVQITCDWYCLHKWGWDWRQKIHIVCVTEANNHQPSTINYQLSTIHDSPNSELILLNNSDSNVKPNVMFLFPDYEWNEWNVRTQYCLLLPATCPISSVWVNPWTILSDPGLRVRKNGSLSLSFLPCIMSLTLTSSIKSWIGTWQLLNWIVIRHMGNDSRVKRVSTELMLTSTISDEGHYTFDHVPFLPRTVLHIFHILLLLRVSCNRRDRTIVNIRVRHQYR